MNINNLSSGYSGYNTLLHTNEDDITQSKDDTATADAKDKASESQNEKPAKTEEQHNAAKPNETQDKINHIVSLQQQIKDLRNTSDDDDPEKNTKLIELQKQLDEALVNVQSLIQQQASTYVSGLFAKPTHTTQSNAGLFLNSKA